MSADQSIDTDERQADGVRSVAATHPGTRRMHNEDAWLNRPDLGLWAVADGAGGHDNGAAAARAVIAGLDAIPAGLSAAEMLAQVRMRLEGTHRSLTEATERQGGGMMASTVVALIMRQGHFAFLWIGNSRAYLLRNGVLDQVTVDHSLVQELLDRGAISAADAENHPQANVITRAIGAAGTQAAADKRTGLALPGDRFLLCSDGVSKAVAAADLAVQLSAGADARAIVAEALARMAGDNVTALTIDVGDHPTG